MEAATPSEVKLLERTLDAVKVKRRRGARRRPHQPERLIADRGYDTNAIRAWCAERGIEVVIPAKRSRKVAIPHDRERYRTRHRIENLFGRMKDATRIILRKDKTSRSYAGFVSLALAIINCQLCP